MNFVLPTYNESKNIVTATGDLVFYEHIQIVDNYSISVFNYRLATYNDFKLYNANELRGLTFVFNLDGSLYKRYILLHKFFNLNQVDETQLCVLKDVPFTAVHDKADGSIITFIRLPNNKVYAKSKVIIKDNIQAAMAQKVYDNSTALQLLVNYTLDNDMVAIFELVSQYKKVVLNYNDTDLVLTRLRDNNTGEYLPVETLGEYLKGVNTVACETDKYKTWDDLLCIVDSTENKEGWVVTLANGMLVKLKTTWYQNLHSLLTEYIYREDYLIDFTLDEKIDDLISKVGEDDVESRDLINMVSDKVNAYIIKFYTEVDKLVDKYYTIYDSNQKEFAIAESNSIYFAFAVKTINGFDILMKVKDYIKRKTYRLEDARYFIRTGDLRK